MSTSPPPVVADRYRLVAPLGQGGMGRVWRATDVVLHRDVAIKELVPPPGLTTEERQEMRERSLREARAIARLNHINVVRVFDVLRTDADPWIVMEYVASRSLQDILAADGPYPAARAAEIGLGVLGALRAAHRAGVVHRDVKPGNVLIGEDGRVVLTDFGLATVPGDPNVTRTGLVLGSPAYIAPERARDGSAGPGADLWSLGATLYAAVEGASPFARPSAIATLAALATENPPPARHAGPLKAVLNGLLRKDPAQRINAEEAERLLQRAAGRRSRISFPMNATMRRPGLGRERPSAPVVPGSPQISGPATASGPTTAAGSAPLVPGPRPPVSPAPPPAAAPGPGRPPVFAPGKATVGRPAAVAADRPAVAAKPPTDAPTRVDAAAPLDATRVDTPAVDATRVGSPALDATSVDTPPVEESRPPLDATRVDTPAVPAADSWTRGRARAVPVISPQSLTKPSGRAVAPSRTSPGLPPAPQVTGPPGADRGTATAVGAASVPVIPAPSTPATPGTAQAAAVDTAEPTTVDAPVDEAPAVEAPGVKDPAVEAPGVEQAEVAPTGQVDAPAPEQAEVATVERTEAPASERTEAAESRRADPEDVGQDDSAPLAEGAAPTSPARGGRSAAEAGSTPTAVATPVAPAPAAAAPAAAGGPKLTRNKIKGKAGRTAKGSRSAARNGRDAAQAAAAKTPVAAAAPAAVDAATTAPSTDEPTPVGSGPTVVDSGPTVVDSGPTVVDSGSSGAGNLVAEGPGTPAETSGATAGVTRTAVAVSAMAGATSTQVDGSGSGRRTPGMRTPSTSEAVPFSGAPVGSNRPPWRPMPVRAPSTGRAGLTVFGVTLDRRQTWILVAIVAAVLLALLLIVPNAFGDEKKDARGPGVGAPGTSAAASTAPTQAPAAPAPAPSTAVTTSAPPTPASTAPPTPTRAAEAPTSQAAPSKAPAQGGSLPAGWRMHRDGSGYAVPVPQGWSIQQQGTETYFREQSGSRRVLIVDQTNTPKPDPEADWTAQERSRRGDYRNYRLLSIDSVSYRGWKAADWEYTYTSRSGNDVHSVKRGFITAPDQAYGISWTTPAGQWDENADDLQVILDNFRPAGS